VRRVFRHVGALFVEVKAHRPPPELVESDRPDDEGSRRVFDRLLVRVGSGMRVGEVHFGHDVRARGRRPARLLCRDDREVHVGVLVDRSAGELQVVLAVIVVRFGVEHRRAVVGRARIGDRDLARGPVDGLRHDRAVGQRAVGIDGARDGATWGPWPLEQAARSTAITTLTALIKTSSSVT
jgi:hypothetical protein